MRKTKKTTFPTVASGAPQGEPQAKGRGSDVVPNAKALAKALGVSLKTVLNWKKVDGCPSADAGGRYRVSEWRLWASENGKKITDAASKGTKSDWEIQKLKKQVESMDLAIRKRRGELVEIEDVKRWAAESAYAVKVELLSIPGKLAPQVVGLTIAEAELRIREAVTVCLMHLHREPWNK